MIKQLCLILLILTVTATLILVLTHISSKEQKVQQEVILAQPEQEIVSLLPELLPICSCESNGRPDREPRQFNADGSVVRGKINHSDVGMCQINLSYHEQTAKKMGINLFSKEGNIRYANYLYETQGSTPWNWSKSCWGNYSKQK